MNVTMQAAVLVATKAAAPTASAGLKWGAVGCGLGLLVLLYLVVAAFSRHWSPGQLVNGFDGTWSTSKFQWFLWLIFILFAYTAIWVLRAEQGNSFVKLQSRSGFQEKRAGQIITRPHDHRTATL